MPAWNDAGAAPIAEQPHAMHSVPALFATSAGAISGGSEPSILTDLNGRFVWMGDTSGVKSSSDNGTSWAPMSYPGNIGIEFSDGVALDQDGAGSLYAAYLHDNRIDVARSDDGMTFGSSRVAAGIFDTVDRPWIAAHGEGEVALFYIDAVGTSYFPAFSGHCARSTDSGLTYNDQKPAAMTPQGGKAFYDSSGRFYYSQSNGVLMRFATTCLAGGQALRMFDSVGENNMIQAEADGDDVYMAATVSGSSQIEVAGLRADGTQQTLVVTPADQKTTVYPTITARNGRIAVAWYGSASGGDPAADGYSGDFRVYVSTVDDFWGNATVSTLQLTEAANHSGTICMGGVGCSGNRELLDYFMLDYDKWGGLHVAYVDDQHGGGTFYKHIAPSQISGKPQSGDPPRAAFDAVADGNLVRADGSASLAAPGQQIANYTWDWGDGSTAKGAKAQHSYDHFGAFTITLKVTDSAGRNGSASRGLVVDDRPPSSSQAPSATKGAPTSSKTSGKASSSKGTGSGSSSGAEGTPGLEAMPVALLLALLALARRPPPAQGMNSAPLSRKP